MLAVPLVLLAARGAEKPVDTYDAFANWTLKAKLLYFDRSFSDATIAPPVHREYPLGLPSLEAFVLHAIGSANVRVLHVLFAVLPRRARARRVARAASARRDVAARRPG